MSQDRTKDRILFDLKAKGPMTAQQVADRFSLSVMGAHKALGALVDDGLVASFDQAEGRGRPRRFFKLTAQGHAGFPDNHAQLTTELISDVAHLFGAEGMDRLIAAREVRQREEYAKGAEGNVMQRAAFLAQKREDEGYMARVETQENGDLLLIEDHCPICAAAEQCHGFCRAELDLFRAVLGEGADVQREEHLLSGGRRCTYRIRKTEKDTVHAPS